MKPIIEFLLNLLGSACDDPKVRALAGVRAHDETQGPAELHRYRSRRRGFVWRDGGYLN